MTGSTSPGRASPGEQIDRAAEPDHPEYEPDDQSLIVAHGARSLCLTNLVVIMVPLSMVTAHPAELPWHWLLLAYAVLAAAYFLRSRTSTSGGIIPPGALGDSRFVLAAAALGIGATPADVAELVLILFLLATALCGASDGAWIATAMRQLRLPFFRDFATLWWPPRAHEACTWRIVMPGPGRDGP